MDLFRGMSPNAEATIHSGVILRNALRHRSRFGRGRWRIRGFRIQGQVQVKTREVPEFALETDFSSLLARHGVAERKAKPFGLDSRTGCEKWIENVLADIFGDPIPAIFNGPAHPVPFRTAKEANLDSHNLVRVASGIAAIQRIASIR